jgi:hypothetical protein
MKISKYKLTTLFCAAIAFGMIASLGQAGNLSGQDKKFLASYEKVHTALAADDLTGAKAAATELGDSGTDIAKAKSLQEARSAFEKVSVPGEDEDCPSVRLLRRPLPNAEQGLGANVDNHLESLWLQRDDRLWRDQEIKPNRKKI